MCGLSPAAKELAEGGGGQGGVGRSGCRSPGKCIAGGRHRLGGQRGRTGRSPGCCDFARITGCMVARGSSLGLPWPVKVTTAAGNAGPPGTQLPRPPVDTHGEAFLGSGDSRVRPPAGMSFLCSGGLDTFQASARATQGKPFSAAASECSGAAACVVLSVPVRGGRRTAARTDQVHCHKTTPPSPARGTPRATVGAH